MGAFINAGDAPGEPLAGSVERFAAPAGTIDFRFGVSGAYPFSISSPLKGAAWSACV
jgi:hypothetical protein